MLRVSTILKGISPFSLFLMDQKKNPALQGLSIAKRGQLLAKMYKQLPPSKKTDLLRRAKKHPSVKAAQRHHVDGRKTTTNSTFREFVKQNYDKVRVLHYTRRFAALSKLYDLQKPIQVGNNIIRVVTPKTVSGEVEASKAKSAHSAVKEASKRKSNSKSKSKPKSKSKSKPKSASKAKSKTTGQQVKNSSAEPAKEEKVAESCPTEQHSPEKTVEQSAVKEIKQVENCVSSKHHLHPTLEPEESE